MRGRWARYVKILRADPGTRHLALERVTPHRAKYAQRRLKALGAEAVTEWHSLECVDLFVRWPA